MHKQRRPRAAETFVLLTALDCPVIIEAIKGGSRRIFQTDEQLRDLPHSPKRWRVLLLMIIGQSWCSTSILSSAVHDRHTGINSHDGATYYRSPYDAFIIAISLK